MYKIKSKAHQKNLYTLGVTHTITFNPFRLSTKSTKAFTLVVAEAIYILRSTRTLPLKKVKHK